MSDEFLNTIEKALQQLSAEETKANLGDRKTYVGASDIGQCSRKAVLAKIDPKPGNLVSLLHTMRGHLAETILTKAFAKAGFNFTSQEEIAYEEDGVPRKVHLDYLFLSAQSIRFLDLKSPSFDIPEFPYDSWELQIYDQLKAVKRKYPDRDIQGALLGFQFGDHGLKFWNGYDRVPEAFAEQLAARARVVWEATVREDPDGVPSEPSPLCSYCDYIRGCPAFQGTEVPELEKTLADYRLYKDQHAILKKDIDRIRDEVLYLVSLTGRPLTAGNFVAKASRRSRTATDWQRLEAFLEEHGSNLSAFQARGCEYQVLDVKEITT